MAHILYDNRSDLRNTEPGDGWNFHGRGYFQYTGRDNYERFGEKFGYDLKNNPDMAADPEIAAKLAVAYWKDRVPEADRSDAYAAGVAINGGKNGADERVSRSAQWASLITPELVRGVQDSSISLDQLATMGNSPQRSTANGHSEGSLRIGASGDRVADLQAQLSALGYTDAQGQPLRADRSFGPATDSAVRAFQRDHDLPADGVVGRQTLGALAGARANPAATLDNPAHAGHAMFGQALGLVQGLDAQQGRASDQLSINLAGSLTAQSRVEGMTRMDHLALSDDASRAYVVQGDLNSPFKQYASVDIAQAVVQPIDQSSHVWTQAHQQQQEQQLALPSIEVTQQAQSAPSMTR
jgi:putative chitinase